MDIFENLVEQIIVDLVAIGIIVSISLAALIATGTVVYSRRCEK